MNEQLTGQKSIYIQIGEMMETDILRGILLEEEQVPSTNELARLYTINPATAAKGVGLLVDEGILYKRRLPGRKGENSSQAPRRLRGKPPGPPPR